ncbi:hypothetical protein BWL13_01080 [Microbacterium oleivorans]|uniref:hypothetical protein n=1 Tax=Microbacterium oleivorans TaxID=273677 RepID=UPI000975C566|nr:hypothetical protein [Microbacterium oleivorans]AZS43520.1 hypothetical protein BWL13_01080 [Microbacterium oleivorans]
MIARRSAVLVATVTLAVALSACTPAAAPTPTPSPTGFASKEEAFAAAEATYRAYVDETNRLLAGDDKADPMNYLNGQARIDEEKVQQLLADSKRRLSGQFQITDFSPESWTSDEVQAFVCLDLSGVRVESVEGASLSQDGRTAQNLLEVRISGFSEPRIISSVLRSESC